MVALNSECDAVGVGGCATSSAQYRWLQQDLATHPNVCTLAYMHKPFWGNATKRLKTKALVQLLYDSGAEVLVSGHDHLYVRFAPQSPTSVASSTGLRQFVVGTGGVSHTKPKANLANTQAKDGTHFGVLRLTLNDSSYDWAFLPDSGGAALDSGSDTCHWPN